MRTYEDAVAELYQAPHGTFVQERKRLATELKAGGDKAGAARLGKLNRPTISAWVVNQLWWQARDAFDALFATADRLRHGDLRANAPHRDAIATLRARAANLLTDAGHAATESTLRRVTQTLAALAATGSWDPDPPGALTADRDPPGFEALGLASVTPTAEPVDEPEEAAAPAPTAPPPTSRRAHRDELAEARRDKAKAEAEAEARARAAAEAERKRIEAERARLRAERHRLETALRAARDELAARTREVASLRAQLAAAEATVADAEATVTELETELGTLSS